MVYFLKKLTSHDHNSSPKGYFWIIILLLLFALSFSIFFFSKSKNYDLSALKIPVSSSKEIDRPSRIYSVYYKNGIFSPTNIRIRSGDTVRFENDSLFGIQVISDPHPQHNDSIGFNSIGLVPPNGVFAYTFSLPGIFSYHNEKNISETGKVIVR